MNYVFGPVPSRRLGYSLGVDVIPHKTCTLDCVYCQLGRTAHRTLERKPWVPQDRVIAEVQEAVSSQRGIDYVTFSGSGEPTLHSGLGAIIAGIKGACSLPVAVITNGTLLYEPDVRDNLMQADLVIPSVDAVTPRIFKRINRPHPDLRMERIIEGLEVFSNAFSGALWVEIMVAQGINDTAEELERIAKVLERVRMDKVQINTVTRPPADSMIAPADHEVLELARDIFGDAAEIIGDFAREKIVFEETDVRQKIISLAGRHPDSADRISRALGIESGIVCRHIEQLVEEGKLIAVDHRGERFYRAARDEEQDGCGCDCPD